MPFAARGEKLRHGLRQQRYIEAPTSKIQALHLVYSKGAGQGSPCSIASALHICTQLSAYRPWAGGYQ